MFTVTHTIASGFDSETISRVFDAGIDAWQYMQEHNIPVYQCTPDIRIVVDGVTINPHPVFSPVDYYVISVDTETGDYFDCWSGDVPEHRELTICQFPDWVHPRAHLYAGT